MVRAALALIIALAAGASLACQPRPPPLDPANTPSDDGHGELSRAARLWTNDEEPEPEAPGPRDELDEYGSGAAYGSNVPSWNYSPTPRVRYPAASGPLGAVEGVITWRGALPSRRTTACGSVEPLRIGADRGVAGVIVYIAYVRAARAVPYDGRPSSIGGQVVRRGCALMPAAQIVTPMPAALSVHSDRMPTRIRVTTPSKTDVRDLEAAGRTSLQLEAGVTRVESEAGDLAAAFVLGIDTPYYAVTDDAGRFRIDELPAGTYELTFWHAPLPTGSSPGLTYGAPISITRTATILAARTSRIDLALDR